MKSKRLQAWSAGIAPAVFAVIFYAPGLGRGLGYDEALTIGNFIATPSVVDPFRRQIGYNNHVLFSFFEHLIYRGQGGWSATSMRALPLAFAVLTVAALSIVLAYRFGPLAGLCGGMVLASNPAFAFAAVTVRGYALLVLASVASTIVLFTVLRESPTKRWHAAAYVVFVAAGLATHLFMALVVMGHVTVVVARGKLSPEWLRRWVTGGVLGMLAYAGVFVGMFTNAGGGRHFYSSLPRQLPAFFFGTPRAAAILIVIVVALGIPGYINKTETKALAVLYAAVFLILWLVAQPQFLYVRFFLWAVPAVACAVAVSVSRRSILVLLVAAAVAVQIVPQVSHRHDEQAPVRIAARVVAAADAMGRRVCADNETRDALIAETTTFATVRRADQIATCDVFILLLPNAHIPVVTAARAAYPFSYELPAAQPGLALSRTPLPCATPQTDDRTIVLAC